MVITVWHHFPALENFFLWCCSYTANCIRRHGINFRLFFNFYCASETINNIKIITRYKKYEINLNTFKQRRIFLSNFYSLRQIFPPYTWGFISRTVSLSIVLQRNPLSSGRKVELDFSLGIKMNSS